MAQGRDQQGTGRHPHKSTEEPWPHTKDEGGQHGRSHSGGRGDDNRSHGGGSHGGSHGGGRDSDNRSQGGSHGRSQETQSQGRDHDREEEADLKRREYRGEDGEIHHHTRTYMEQHAHDRGGEENRGGGSRGGGSHGGGGSQGRSQGRDNNNSGRR